MCLESLGQKQFLFEIILLLLEVLYPVIWIQVFYSCSVTTLGTSRWSSPGWGCDRDRGHVLVGVAGIL